MEPREIRPAVRVKDGDTVEFATVDAALERRRAQLGLISTVPPKLAKMLLPGEKVRFGSDVHPIVLLPPVVLSVAIVVLLETALAWTVSHGGSRIPLLTGWEREAALAAAIALLAGSAGLLVKRAMRFAGLRIVATNRRIFAIRGVIVRRITPLGNTALAASTLSQGLLGRMLGYGSIELPLADGTPGSFRDMRDALQLYREFQAVANGVDGDTWTPAIRQTIIP
jgi:Bacterial PH domain